MRSRPAIAATLALGGCSGAQTPLAPVADQAGSQYHLLLLMLWVCGVMYLLVIGFLIIGLWRARGRHAAAPPPLLEPADDRLRRLLAVWAAVVVIGLLVLAGGSFLVERSLALAQANESLRIRVTAHQYWWRIAYRDPASGRWVETANELHLPVARTARIELGSADVIHSFWVPNISGKMDVIPGRANAIDLTPRRLGWFRGQCAEFCGPQHAHMGFDVKVETSAAFDAWLAAQARPAAAPRDAEQARGMEVVTREQCAMCHTVRGTAAIGRNGPDLTHIGSRHSIAAGTLTMTRAHLQGWIAQPQAIKPGTMMPTVTLSPADANAAAAYLESLK